MMQGWLFSGLVLSALTREGLVPENPSRA